MKIGWILVVVVLAAITGLAVALGYRGVTLFSDRADLVGPIPIGNDPCLPPLPPADGPQPKVVVDAESYDFGEMELHSTRSHTFVFRNAGQFPLLLRKGETTCKCTLSDVGAAEIPPGGTRDVTLEFKLEEPTSTFRQEATICTNDRNRPKVVLTITGKISASVVVMPQFLLFNKIGANDAATKTVTVYSTHDEPLQLTPRSPAEGSVASRFQWQTKPAPAETTDMHLLSAKSGVQVVAELKPGLLRPGNYADKIVFDTNYEDVPPVEIPISIRIDSDLTVIGPDFRSSTKGGRVTFGKVDGAQGASRQFKIMVKGPHRDEVDVRVAEVVPSELVVKIGEKKQIGAGAVVEIPFWVEVPRGCPPMTHLATEASPAGKIRLDTNHPDTPQLEISVIFAVQ